MLVLTAKGSLVNIDKCNGIYTTENCQIEADFGDRVKLNYTLGSYESMDIAKEVLRQLAGIIAYGSDNKVIDINDIGKMVMYEAKTGRKYE